MCYVIVTCRSMLWSLLSIASFMLLLAAVTSPHWLIGFERIWEVSHHSPTGHPDNYNNNNSLGWTSTRPAYEVEAEKEEPYHPSLGLYNLCLRLRQYQVVVSATDRRDNCAPFVNDFLAPDDKFPHTWKASLVLFGLAGVLLVITSVAAVMSVCMRTVCGKSIFTLAGLLQSIAGLLCILALVVYPAGWGTERVRRYCGDLASPFSMDRCHLGSSFIMCVVGTLMTFLCSMLSIKADSATSCRKVEEEIIEGKNLICVL